MKAEIETLHEWRRRAEPAYLSRLFRAAGGRVTMAARLAARIEKHARATGLRSRQEEEVEPVAGD